MPNPPSRRLWIPGLAALVLLVVGATVLLVPRGEPPTPAQAAPSPPAAVLEQPLPDPSPELSPDPERQVGHLAAVSLDRYLQVWRGPSEGSEPKLLLDTRNPFGQRLAMLVDEVRERGGEREWLRILLPDRPNGSTGWVRAEDVRVVTRNERLVVSLSKRTLSWFRDGVRVATFSVGVGRPEYPTATGTFYVWARVPQADPSGPYGVYALGISGFSPVLSDWPGGGRMAVHGTSNPGDRGNAVSHGCVRVYNDDMRALTKVKLGTPVIIRG